jgi:diguanylate cyclase (GGDEF)-like protein
MKLLDIINLNLLQKFARQLSVAIFLVSWPWMSCQAMPFELSGLWFQAQPDWQYGNQSRLEDPLLTPVEHPALTGGHFLFQSDFEVGRDGSLVVDFKNSSVIGQFRHFVFDSRGQLVAKMEGGIQNATKNPFFLRHGREFQLAPGHYRLITELSSPFFLAQPQPYLDTPEHYQQAIKAMNALTLVCMGIFIGLGIYYAALAAVSRRVAEGMYALFILGNLLYNGTALLVFPELFDLHWFYLISVPILFSNCAYVVFVIALLEIRRDSHPRLFRSGMALLGMLASFIVLAAIMPHWSLELDRYGVGLFLLYGFSAGIIRSREGNASAKFYLAAIGVFFVLGLLSISLGGLSGVYTMYIEHLGLVSVIAEVMLLALVLSYQFGQLRKEKESALVHAERNFRIAYTDALTGLPNRYALDISIAQLPKEGSLTFIDLDGLKFYNDQFGHQRGDELLCCFANLLSERLGETACVHRLGGDEFAITYAKGDLEWINMLMAEVTQAMHYAGFEFAGASFGSVHVHEAPEIGELKHLADTRMYEEKRRRKSQDLFSQN